MMSSRIFSRIFLSYLLIAGTECLGQTKWTPYLSSISFKIKNAGITVEGSLKGFNGELSFSNEALPASSLAASVQVATINTGNAKRDTHLKSDDYFDASKFKTIRVKSKKLYKAGDGYAGLFDVTIKNITREIEIPFLFTVNGNNAVFEGSFAINRRDYGVGGRSLVLGDQVTISIVVNTKK